MSITWIIILSIFGLIITILVFKIIYSYFFSTKKNIESDIFQVDIDYYEPLIELANLIKIIEENENKISEINFKDSVILILNNIEKMPEAVFGSYLEDIKTNVIDNIKKFKTNSISSWIHKFQKEINFIKYKINDLEKNDDFSLRVKENYKKLNEKIGENNGFK